MITTRTRTYLQGCILAISLIIPIMAEEVERIPGSGKRSFAEPTQPKKRWRRASFDCGKCDSGVITAPVTVYADRDGGGEGKIQGFKPGIHRADRGGLREVGNDTISSLVVEEGYVARLCQDEGNGRGAGQCQEFASGQHNVSAEMDNQTSFISVRKKR
jgi:hypothetical protein